MTYERFASVYDFLMEDVPYDKWMDFFSSIHPGYLGKAC